MDGAADMVLVTSSFPVTGQPIRVVMIDGEPWFATADVCAVLGLLNPSRAGQIAGAGHTRTVNSRLINLTLKKVNDVSAGGKRYGRGNPMLNLISEAGLYRLIMRSDKPNARPFQEWVTDGLLPSVRRGEADLGQHRVRMAETLAEAIGQQVQIVADLKREDGLGILVHSDGSVHCRHGAMEFRTPARQDDSGPPFGPSYHCPSVEHVGIRGSVALPRCPRLKLVEFVRLLVRDAQRRDPGGTVECELGRVRFSGAPPDIADLLREIGEA